MFLKEGMGENIEMAEDIPDKERQRHITIQLMKKSLVRDDVWFVVDTRWFRNFQQYVGFDSDPDTPPGEEHPGPIDNRPILDDNGDLKEHLCEGNDFVLVPDELWGLLVKWYGIVYDQKPIERKVVEYGAFTKSCKVEIYLLSLQFCKDFDSERVLEQKFSKSDTIGYLIDCMKKQFRIPTSTNVRLLACFNNKDYTELIDAHTVNEEGLYINQILVLSTSTSQFLRKSSQLPPFSEAAGVEHENPVSSSFSSPSLPVGAEADTPTPGPSNYQAYSADAECARAYPHNISPASSTSSSPRAYFPASSSSQSQSSLWSVNPEPGCSSSGHGSRPRSATSLTSCGSVLSQRSPVPSTSSMSTRYSGSSAGYSRMNQPSQPGICGLSNLGNTCFMNSVIQCMSNCPPISEFFLTDDYQRELNTDNPLGMKGEIAMAFADLIRIIWSGQHTYTVPHNFKHQVGKFAPQFSGYQQHDSQELLTFLLDGLHEDLNRIRQKPYIELRDAAGRPDKEVAEESWRNYRKRNDSIIVDVFHGLLKSTVVCPDCLRVSITFDPFCYLSLPLPLKRERFIEVTFVPHEPTASICKFRLSIPRKGTIQALLTAFTAVTRTRAEHLIVAEIQSHHFHKFYTVNDSLESIDDKDDIYIYEVPDKNNSNMVTVPVCLWQYNPNQSFNFSQLFGVPMILAFRKEQVPFTTLYDAIIEKLTRFLVSQDDSRLHRLSVNEHNAGAQLIENQMDDADNVNRPCNGDVAEDLLFSLSVINPATTSVLYNIHEGVRPLDLTGHIGGQYVVAKWNEDVKQQYYQEYEIQTTDAFESRNRRNTPRLSLQECISLYTMTEELGANDAWFCPTCRNHMCATKKFDLWSLPQILIIHLKRFSYSKYKRDKIDTLVEFPIRGLDMSDYIINPDHPPATYDLIGVCNHYGGMGGGHYTAFAKNRLDNKWYCFDDNNVSEAGEYSVVSKDAYVLFYMKTGSESQQKYKADSDAEEDTY